MKIEFAVVAMIGFLGTAVSYAQETSESTAPTSAPIPRDHVDSTIVGDAASDSDGAKNSNTSIDNNRHFQAGAPDMVSVTQSLHLTMQQKMQIHTVVENSDAGSAVFLKRENTVREMLAATTPDDPLYAKLKSEQALADARWADRRNELRQSVADLLTPTQRLQFQKSMSTR